MSTIYNFKKLNPNKVSEYIINNNEVDSDNINPAINYLSEKNISILYDNFYFTYTDGLINALKVNSFGDKYLLAKFNNEEAIKSDLYNDDVKKRNLSEDNEREMFNYIRAMGETLSMFIYVFLNKTDFENNKRSNSTYKVIKGYNYYQVKMKKLDVEMKIYEKVEGYYSYREEDNKIKLTLSNLYQDEKVIPSKLYPLPHDNYKVFTSDNTCDLEDDKVNELLSNVDFKIGRCYTNSDLILDILRKNNIKAKYYSGWILKLNKMIHHAWIVINNKHLIDVGIPQKEFEFLKEKPSEHGLMPKISFIDELAKIMAENIPFKEKYCYGKVREDLIYIGSPSNSYEARASYNKLMEDIPDHPDYQNIDKKGVNKTQRALYKKVYNEII